MKMKYEKDIKKEKEKGKAESGKQRDHTDNYQSVLI